MGEAVTGMVAAERYYDLIAVDMDVDVHVDEHDSVNRDDSNDDGCVEADLIDISNVDSVRSVGKMRP